MIALNSTDKVFSDAKFYETDPEKVGVEGKLLSKAIDFAIKNESTMDRDIGAALEQGHFKELGRWQNDRASED